MEDYHLLRRSFTVKPPTALRGEGSYLILDNGEKVIDASGGAGVLSIGHGNKEVAEAIAHQASTICYVTPATYTNQPAEDLANELIPEKYEKMGYSKVMFVNSGSEANENTYKLVRSYYYNKGDNARVNVIGRDMAYHGNTLVGLALSGTPHRKLPYEALIPYERFHKVSTPQPKHLKLEGESDDEYVQRLLKELDQKFIELGPETVMAVWFEPILGTSGGCTSPPKGYLKGVKSLCNKYGACLVYDEVICGSGRSGKHFFAWENLIDEGDTYEDIQPDVVTIGKTLAGGYAPLSGLIFHKKFTDNFISTSKAFLTGHTFQAHIVSCAAGLAVQRYIRKNNLLENIDRLGPILREKLMNAIGDYDCVYDIRGRGFFWTVELVKNKETKECFPLDYDFGTLAFKHIFKHGVSVYAGKGSIDGVHGHGFLVAPAFNADEELIDKIVEGIRVGLKDALQEAHEKLKY